MLVGLNVSTPGTELEKCEAERSPLHNRVYRTYSAVFCDITCASGYHKIEILKLIINCIFVFLSVLTKSV